MGSIDADAHVHETLRTWDYMSAAEATYKPRVVRAYSERLGRESDWWLIDDRLQPKEENVGQDTTMETREAIDVQARLRHMDELEIDVQVIYPTIFLRPLTDKPDVEIALCRSYNRWLADVCAETNGRLRWIALPPVLALDEALAELRWAKEHGAVGVFLRGLEAEKRVSDPYFFPLYAEAERLDLPIGIHSGTGAFTVHDFFPDEPGFCKFKLAVVGAFHSLLMTGVPAKFPALRWGFIEVSAQWVPYAIHDLRRRLAKQGRDVPRDVLQRNNIWVACQTDDDLDYVLGYTGDDHIVIGTDYGHDDTSSEIEALRRLREMGTVPVASIDKILDANARALYHL